MTFGNDIYSYRELNEKANRLAHLLIHQGVTRGSVVGVCLERSAELVVSVLAILKAGAAYSPLDATYPQERLNLMISQLDCMQWVIGSSDTSVHLDSRRVNLIDIRESEHYLDEFSTQNPSFAMSDLDLCYVVFTSGSTGIPKATAIRHIGWCNLLSWLIAEFGLDKHSSNLLVSSFGFDISQRSIMTPLCTGSVLHVLPSSNFDAMIAKRMIGKLSIRTLHCAPSTLYLLVEREMADGDEALASLEYVFVGGEPLSAGRVANWATKAERRGKLVNVYGVAECTDVSSFYILKDFAKYTTSGVPIGKPIRNTQIHILDKNLLPVNPGEVGEICISGVGVGAGYLNNETMNKERFLKLGLESGDVKIYRTGDLGKVYSDGNFACLGRADNQVKIRGIRLDLGDVETSLNSSEMIEDAVAIVADKGEDGEDTDLVAFVIPSSRAYSVERGCLIDERSIRTEFLTILPKHMVPTRFLIIDSFPLNPNGKVDRRKLLKVYKDSFARSM